MQTVSFLYEIVAQEEELLAVNQIVVGSSPTDLAICLCARVEELSPPTTIIDNTSAHAEKGVTITMMIENTNEGVRHALPNKAFDSEYATQYRHEVLYLKDRGIDYTYVKKVGKYKIPTYKYTKTPELFRAVADFYEMRHNEKQYEELDRLVAYSAGSSLFLKDVLATVPNILQKDIAHD